MVAELLDGVIQFYKLRVKSVNEKIKKEIKKEEQVIKKEETDLEKEMKEEKPITNRKHSKELKTNNIGKIEKKTDGQRIIEAKRAKQVRLLQLKKLSLQGLILVLKLIKYIIQIIESFIRFLVMFLGVVGFFVVVFVVVLMIAIYGLLHLDDKIIPAGDIFTSEDCIQGGEVINGTTNSSLGNLSGAMTPYHQALYKTYTVYNDIFSRDPASVFEKSTNLINLLGVLNKEDVSRFLFGFSAVETSFLFYNDDKDVLQYPSKKVANEAGYAFLGLHYNNVFGSIYKYNGVNGGKVLIDSFVNEWKQKYKPIETPMYENNFIPYGAATQTGVFVSDSLNKKYNFIANNIGPILDAYGIKVNRDKVTAYCQLFAGAAAYHSGGGSIDSNLLSLWVALWSSTSTNDNERSFNNIKIIGADDKTFSESSSRPNILGKTSGDFILDRNTNGLAYFSINNQTISEALWSWVSKNCSNSEYFESTASVWLNEKAGGTKILDAHYGLISYLQGNRVVEFLGSDMPVASGGSIDECECVDTESSGSYMGNIDISNIQVGVPQGPWSEEIKTYLMSETNSNLGYGTSSISVLKKYYGQVYAITNKDDALLGKTFESWRTSTKWQVPMYIQSKGNVESGENNVIPTFAGGTGMGAGCHIYMYSYMASALTSSLINPVEMAVAASKADSFTGLNPYTGFLNTFNALGLKAVGFRKSSNSLGGDTSDFESFFGLSISEYQSSESSVLQKVVDTVLEKNGLFGYASGYDGTHVKFTSKTSNHYVVISEKVGDEYRVIGYTKNGYSGGTSTGGDLFTWDDIFYSMYAHKSGNTGYNGQRFVAWNPNLKSFSNSSTTTSTGKFTTYDLTDEQLQKLANLCKQEQGSLEGTAAEASLMANLFEINMGGSYKGVEGSQGLYNYVRNSGWFAKAAHHMDNGSATQEYVDVVKKVLVEGYRTLPGYVNQHYTQSVLKDAKNDGVSFDPMDSSQYIPFKTVLYESSRTYWTFYSFPTENSDPFGYGCSEEVRASIGEFCYEYGTWVGKEGTDKKIEFSNLLFIGDSYTDGLNMNMGLESNGHSVFAAVSASPGQFIGSTTSSVTIGAGSYEKTGQIPDGNYNAIVVLLGVNNISQTSEMKIFLQELSEKFKCPIFVQKVFPVGTSYSEMDASEMNLKINDYNKVIKEFCDSSDGVYIFIDTTTGLVNSEGYLEPTSDGLHLKDKLSYETWYNNIKNVITSYGVSENGPFDNVECIEVESGSGSVSSVGALDLSVDVIDKIEECSAGWSQNGGKIEKVEFITIHYWAYNNSKYKPSALNLISMYTSPSAMAHFLVDSTCIIQDAPLDVAVYHNSGKSDYVSIDGIIPGHNNSIGIEVGNAYQDINNDGVPEYVFEKSTLENAIALTKALMIKYDLDVDRVLRHYDHNMKLCPYPFIDLEYHNQYDNQQSKYWVAFKQALMSDTIDWDSFGSSVIEDMP